MAEVQEILTDVKMPFCPGCGHRTSTKSVSKALTQAGYAPSDVVIVSDIGCSGLVDPLFATHTVHGLHGRSPALALGISLGLSDPSKKVIVIQGDGGATIGLQHLLEAARRNVNMTLIVLNNLIYGMTGGQISGLSTNEFKEARNVDDSTPPFDICELVHSAGASYSARVTSPKSFNERLLEAFGSTGFSLLEISSLCQPYGAAKMAELESLVEEDVVLKNDRAELRATINKTTPLFNYEDGLDVKYDSTLDKPMGIVLAGSAGGGIQSAANLLANAGILSGLSVTMKGEYPITVGTGFSMAEVVFSKNKINYTGLESADVLIIVSEDGMLKVKDKVSTAGTIILDEKLENKEALEGFTGDFVKRAGKKGAALCALAWWLNQSGVIPVESLIEASGKHKHGDKLEEIINSSKEITTV